MSPASLVTSQLTARSLSENWDFAAGITSSISGETNSRNQDLRHPPLEQNIIASARQESVTDRLSAQIQQHFAPDTQRGLVESRAEVSATRRRTVQKPVPTSPSKQAGVAFMLSLASGLEDDICGIACTSTAVVLSHPPTARPPANQTSRCGSCSWSTSGTQQQTATCRTSLTPGH